MSEALSREAITANEFFAVEWIDRDGGRIQVTTAGRTFTLAGSRQDAAHLCRMLAAVIGTAFRRSAESISNWQNTYD